MPVGAENLRRAQVDIFDVVLLLQVATSLRDAPRAESESVPEEGAPIIPRYTDSGEGTPI